MKKLPLAGPVWWSLVNTNGAVQFLEISIFPLDSAALSNHFISTQQNISFKEM